MTSTNRWMRDIPGVLADAEELMRITDEQGGERVREAQGRLRESLAAVRATLAQLGVATGAQTREALASVRRGVEDHPWAAVGVAALAGIALGILLQRR